MIPAITFYVIYIEVNIHCHLRRVPSRFPHYYFIAGTVPAHALSLDAVAIQTRFIATPGKASRYLYCFPDSGFMAGQTGGASLQFMWNQYGEGFISRAVKVSSDEVIGTHQVRYHVPSPGGPGTVGNSII